MDIGKRILRKPFTTALWIILCAAVSAFFLTGVSLWYSTSHLQRSLSENNMTVAVRSDQQMVQSGTELLPEERSFTQADKAWLEQLDSVKAVRTHAVSAASCPALSPLLEINRAKSFQANGNPLPYSYAAFIGTVASTESDHHWMYLSMELEQIVLFGDEYERCGAREVLENAGSFTAVIDISYIFFDPELEDRLENGFQSGTRCLLAGYYDPGVQLFTECNPKKIPNLQLLYLGNLKLDGDLLLACNVAHEPIAEPGLTGSGQAYRIADCEEGYMFPAVAVLEDSFSAENAETLIQSLPDPRWEAFYDAWQRQAHSFPVVGTEHLEAMYAFMSDRATLKNGRTFTEEEYAQGAPVLMISQKLADQCGIAVGDTLSLSQYLCHYGSAGYFKKNEGHFDMQPGGYYNDPSVDALYMGELSALPTREFTVVGTYELLADWTYGPYDFGPNTLLMPKKTQIDGAFGEIPEESGDRDIYGMLLSVELESGRMEEFMTALESSPYERQFFAYDQGFENVQKNVQSLLRSMTRLLYFSLLGAGVFLLLYLLMYQGSEKKNLGTMRSLGISPSRCGLYLLGGGMLVAALGILLGTLGGGALIRLAQESILEDAIAGLDLTQDAAQAAASEATLRQLMQESLLPASGLWLLAGLEWLAVSISLLIHSCILLRRSPRKLMEG